MISLTPIQKNIYRAIRAIESFPKSANLIADTKTIVSFVTGAEDSQYLDFFTTYEDLYKSLPKANFLSVLSVCTSLVEAGYLKKTSSNGNIVFTTTSLSPFKKKTGLFVSKLTKYQATLFESVRSFINNYWPNCIENDQSDYFGFKKKAKNTSFEKYNWFWFTTSGTFQGLVFKYKEIPYLSNASDPIFFDAKSVNIVIDIVSRLLKDNKGKYGVNLNEDIHFALDPESLESPINQTQNIAPKETPFEEPVRPLLFADFAGNNYSKVMINNGQNSMDALLSVGEASPYHYDEKTYSPNEETKLLYQGKKSFNFLMRKWKLVAWSVPNYSFNQVYRALFINKKSKKLWIVLSVPDKRVVCVSRAPFIVCTDQNKYLPDELITMLFPEDY